MIDIDIRLDEDAFRELVKTGAVETDDGTVAVRQEDWIPTVVELLNE